MNRGKPDFICIGAQKAATTWLFENLRLHPAIALPPLKEIHYFDRSCKPYLLDALSRNFHRRYMLRRWLRLALHDLRQHPQHLAWHLRFFLHPRSDSWYQSLFHVSPGQISGDITPGYARLDAAGIDHVKRLLPDVKIIYVLRNPIERMWSQAAMYFSRYGNKGLEQATIEEIMAFLDWPPARRNSDYMETIRLWTRQFSAENICIVYFDQVRDTPECLLNIIQAFLGVTPIHPPRPLVSKKVHARTYPEMPQAIAKELQTRYHSQLEEIHQMFPNDITAQWVKNIR